MMLAVKPVADSGKAELVAVRVSGDRAVEKTNFRSMPGQSQSRAGCGLKVLA